MTRVFPDLEAFAAAAGEPLGASEWWTVTQEQIDAFADATGDHQWIHVDPERAATGPFGHTIAHGYLTLSLIPALSAEIYAVEGVASGVNYGLDKVRFPSPVPVDSRIRATATLVDTTEMALGTQAKVAFVMEREGGDKPVLVAEVRYVLTAS